MPPAASSASRGGDSVIEIACSHIHASSASSAVVADAVNSSRQRRARRAAQPEDASCSSACVASAPAIAAKPMSDTAAAAVRSGARMASSIAAASDHFATVNLKSPCVLCPSLPTAVQRAL
jgi:hypothetical protein